MMRSLHTFVCSSTFCFSLDGCCVVRLTGLRRNVVSCHDDVYTRAFLVGFVVRTGANEVGWDMRLRGVRSGMRLRYVLIMFK